MITEPTKTIRTIACACLLDNLNHLQKKQVYWRYYLLKTTFPVAVDHLENKNIYARMQPIDINSAINTIISNKPISKLWTLAFQLSSATSFWTSWLSDLSWFELAVTLPPSSIPVPIRIVCNPCPPLCPCIASTRSLRLLIIPFLLARSTRTINSNTTRTLYSNDDTEYRKEIWYLVPWCQNTNLAFNVCKTKELDVDLRKWGSEHKPMELLERGLTTSHC